ncbi:MAG: enoyl-CoA hydratase/isomerase family protein [Chloroflexi bacterium]|nr:enoyl-CoA hydratase/isomerase family protein [Chloroflexota bacterium]
MSEAYVNLTKEAPLGIITLNRPPANSYDIKFMQDLDTAIEGVATDAEIKAALLVSASEKFFSGGADIKAFLANTPEANVEMVNLAHQALAKIAHIPKIFIAVINGHAMGGGLEMALACDLRFAGEGNFRLGLPESTLGLLPGNGGTQRLSRLIGASRALELMLNGETIGPGKACDLGIVNKVFQNESVLEEAKAYALKLANGPTRALAYIKRCVYEGMEQSLADGLQLERALVAELFASEDAQEGLAAFVEKRKAEFKGK